MSRPMPRSRASDRGILLSSSRRSARSQKHGATRARRGGMPARVAAMTKRGCGYPPAAVGDPWITAARPCLLRAGRFPVLRGTGKARTLTPTPTPHPDAAHAPRAEGASQDVIEGRKSLAERRYARRRHVVIHIVYRYVQNIKTTNRESLA
jgi:hypothetical protein